MNTLRRFWNWICGKYEFDVIVYFNSGDTAFEEIVNAFFRVGLDEATISRIDGQHRAAFTRASRWNQTITTTVRTALKVEEKLNYRVDRVQTKFIGRDITYDIYFGDPSDGDVKGSILTVNVTGVVI